MTYLDFKSILEKQMRREKGKKREWIKGKKREIKKGKIFLRHQLERGRREFSDKYLSSKGSGDNNGDEKKKPTSSCFLLSTVILFMQTF